MATLTANANTTGFLSNDFPHNPPRLYITAESDEFDDQTLQNWQDEGFNVAYVPMEDGGKEYGQRLDNLSRVGLGVGETFAIAAYGDAASFCLEHYRHRAANKLCALVAYYPTAIPDPSVRLPSVIRVLVHLAGFTVGVNRTDQLLGIQGKRRTVKKRISPGIGTGGTLRIAYPTYTYEDAEPGFAEHDLDEYERVSAELAWSRSLEVLRRAFRMDVNLEIGWEKNVQSKFFDGSSSSIENRVSGIMDTLTTHKTPRVTHTPTLTGGIGAAELRRFYADFFIPSNPPSMRFRLLSRTIGADRVVDELYVYFQHTQVIPWILPAIPATNKNVEIIVISIVCVRGGKLYQEHVYWDQASVLVQVGLLDPKLVPEKMKTKGVKRLPVTGRDAARQILNNGKRGVRNQLIPGWEEEQSEEEIGEGDDNEEKFDEEEEEDQEEKGGEDDEEEIGEEAGKMKKENQRGEIEKEEEKTGKKEDSKEENGEGEIEAEEISKGKKVESMEETEEEDEKDEKKASLQEEEEKGRKEEAGQKQDESEKEDSEGQKKKI